MKKKTVFLRCLCIVLSILLSCSAFVSCSNLFGKDERSDSESNETTARPSNGEEQVIQSFSVADVANMKIVYPQDCPDTVATEVDSLRQMINKTYGVDIVSATDYLRAGSEIYCEIPNEILIGGTNREEDDAFYASMGYEDYGYTISGGKIVILGGNSAATVKAIVDFAYNIVMMKKGGDETFFCMDFAMKNLATYNLADVLLNNVSVREYQIVYPKLGSKFEEQLAIHVATNIQALTGHRIPVVSDKTAYADKYEILIGKTNRSGADSLYTAIEGDMKGRIAGNGKFIALYGNTAHGNAIAVGGLIDLVKSATPSASKTVSLTLSNTLLEETDKIAAMTYNIFTGDVSPYRSERVYEMILRYLPDVLGVQEANVTWMTQLKSVFSEYYGVLGEGRNGGMGGEHSAILYSKERFELLDSGTKWLSETPDEVSKLSSSAYIRIITYALLKDRVSGETTLFVNTHLDSTLINKEQTDILFELVMELGYEDYPMVLTGDFNAKITDPALKRMVASGLTPSDKASDVSEGASHIDFVMVTTDCIDVSFSRICGETIGGIIPSDHRPVYAEFTVSTPEGGIDHDYRMPLETFPSDWLELERDDSGEFEEVILIPRF